MALGCGGGEAIAQDIEVTAAQRPTRIVERNIAQKAKRTGQGTYTLEPTADGGDS